MFYNGLFRQEFTQKEVDGNSMGRIRSIKPEFVTDGKISRLSDSCALFFILLWTQCDDYGFFTWDTLELSLKLPRWRSQDMFKLCRKLVDEGLVRCSSSVGVGQVIGWDHQKIKDRRASKWNDLEIEWDDPKNDAPRSYKKPPRIGKDRIGKDRIGGEGSESAAEPSPESSSDSENPISPKTKKEPPPHMKLLDLWNQLCGDLPKIYKTNEARLKNMKARWAEEPNEVYWVDVISKIKSSKFCSGENDRGWVANFDFLLKPDTHIKATEGQYDSREGKVNRPLTHSEIRSQANREQLEKIMKDEL